MNDNEIRERLARYMFERSEAWRSLCSPEDADWDEWVERNREEWRTEADEILAEIAKETSVTDADRSKANDLAYDVRNAEAWPARCQARDAIAAALATERAVARRCPECAGHRTVRVTLGGTPVPVPCPVCTGGPSATADVLAAKEDEATS